MIWLEWDISRLTNNRYIPQAPERVFSSNVCLCWPAWGCSCICTSTAVRADLVCTQMHFTYWGERERGDRKEIMRRWPQWSSESRRLLGMRKGTGSERYNGQQGQSSVCVCLCNPYASTVWANEWTSASLVMWSCKRERASELHSCACILSSEQSVPAVLRERAVYHVTPLRCSSAMEPDS